MDIRAVLCSNIVHFYVGSKEVAKAHTDYVIGKGFEPKGVPSPQLKSIIGAYVTKRLVASRDDLGLGGDTVRFERTNRINKVRCANYGSYFYVHGILFKKVYGFGYDERALYIRGDNVLVSDVARRDLTFLCYVMEVGEK